MTTETVQLWPLVRSQIASAGTPVTAAYGPMLGGYVLNPLLASDQGLTTPESIFVNIVEAAGLIGNGDNVEIFPGGTFTFQPGFAGSISINAQSVGHKFSGVVYQPAPGYIAPSSGFPSEQPTSVPRALPQYLYEQYADDEDLLAFVDAYNFLIQQYVTFLRELDLPVYSKLSGQLLDWMMDGLYGLKRPSLPSGASQNLGALNTIMLNTLPLNEQEIIGPGNYYLTTDDVFKRIATWYKWLGDGKLFNVRMIKRRVKRFLTGEDGGAGQTDETYDISVTFGTSGQININLQSKRRFSTGGSILNVGTLNSFAMNEYDTDFVSVPVSPLVQIFKAAVESGALPFPFQLTPVVNVN